MKKLFLITVTILFVTSIVAQEKFEVLKSLMHKSIPKW